MSVLFSAAFTITSADGISENEKLQSLLLQLNQKNDVSCKSKGSQQELIWSDCTNSFKEIEGKF